MCMKVKGRIKERSQWFEVNKTNMLTVTLLKTYERWRIKMTFWGVGYDLTYLCTYFGKREGDELKLLRAQKRKICNTSVKGQNTKKN